MADWGQLRMDAWKAKLDALRGAREGALSRGLQMQQSLGNLGQSIKGGFGDLTKHFRALGAEKRGYEHERGMEGERTHARQFEQSVEHRFREGESTKERISREKIEKARLSATPEELRMVRELFPDATPEEQYLRVTELRRAGNAADQKEYASASSFMDSKWLVYLEGLPKVTDPDTLQTVPDRSKVNWDAFRQELMDGLNEESEAGRLAIKADKIDDYVDNFIRARREQAETDVIVKGDDVDEMAAKYSEGKVWVRDLMEDIMALQGDYPGVDYSSVVEEIDESSKDGVVAKTALDRILQMIRQLTAVGGTGKTEAVPPGFGLPTQADIIQSR